MSNGTTTPPPVPCPYWPYGRGNKPYAGYDTLTCQNMIVAVNTAMLATLAGGVEEYHIGGRGLKRFSLKDLQGLLAFWTSQLQASYYGGSIVARRVMPCDF